MARQHARQRARYSSDIGQLRGEIFRKAFDRASSAYASGFYLEAVALIESLMADRLESIISVVDGAPATFGTVNQGVADLKRRFAGVPGADEVPLLNALTEWGHDRGRWIHEFAKVSAEGDPAWDERLEEARRVAREGLELLKALANESRQILRMPDFGTEAEDFAG